ncbi:CBS domain-containing protein [Pseudonocardia lacus]|uniref:CBS domain-containing protein n=1 Tax=Pseudonocardia lacus TaxID=2835865 RepID=UPI001BDC28F8|nr:CBS domain-containing protein [Pseudonocardia lacus]
MHTTTAPTDPIATIAATVVAEVDSSQTLRAVAEELVADEIGAVVVRVPGRPSGLISERDLAAVVAAGGEPGTVQAVDLMTTELVTAAPGDSIAEVGARMLDAGIRHVVLHDGEQVVGIVSIRDVLGVLLSPWTARTTGPTRGGRQ